MGLQYSSAMDIQALKHFTAFEQLPASALERLADEGQVKTFSARDALFHHGDNSHDALYLLAGEVQARYPDGRKKNLTPDDPNAHYPIGNLNPRPFDLVAVSRTVEVFMIDREAQDRILSLASLSEQDAQSNNEAMVVQETEVDPQWLFRMLQAPPFASMPADKLDQFMAAIEQIEVQAGDIIIRQGEPGDYYYLIQKGSALVERTQGTVSFPIATLQADSAFGEEALLKENAVRNASVRMLEDGSLVRLHAEAFKQLLEPAFLHAIPGSELPTLLKNGEYQLVDVRLQPEFARHHLKGSINLPLFQLRARMSELPQGKPLLLLCDSGVQSRVAAFILKEKGFDTAVLEGGLSQLQPDKNPNGQTAETPEE